MSSSESHLAELLGSAWHVNSANIVRALGFVSGTGSPVASVTPEFVGQTYFDNADKLWYRATGLTSTDWAILGDPGLSATEIAFLDGAAAGTVVASKAAIYSSTGSLSRSSATLSAVGTNQATAAALSAELNVVSAADDTKGVKLPAAAADRVVVVINAVRTAGLKVYPATGASINGGSQNAAVTVRPGQMATFVGRSATDWRLSINPLGEAVTDKIGFYGKTPTAQPAATAQSAVSMQTTSTTTALRTDLNKVHTLLTAIRTALVNIGAIKGAA